MLPVVRSQVFPKRGHMGFLSKTEEGDEEEALHKLDIQSLKLNSSVNIDRERLVSLAEPGTGSRLEDIKALLSKKLDSEAVNLFLPRAKELEEKLQHLPEGERNRRISISASKTKRWKAIPEKPAGASIRGRRKASGKKETPQGGDISNSSTGKGSSTNKASPPKKSVRAIKREEAKGLLSVNKKLNTRAFSDVFSAEARTKRGIKNNVKQLIHEIEFPYCENTITEQQLSRLEELVEQRKVIHECLLELQELQVVCDSLSVELHDCDDKTKNIQLYYLRNIWDKISDTASFVKEADVRLPSMETLHDIVGSWMEILEAQVVPEEYSLKIESTTGLAPHVEQAALPFAEEVTHGKVGEEIKHLSIAEELQPVLAHSHAIDDHPVGIEAVLQDEAVGEQAHGVREQALRVREQAIGGLSDATYEDYQLRTVASFLDPSREREKVPIPVREPTRKKLQPRSPPSHSDQAYTNEYLIMISETLLEEIEHGIEFQKRYA